MADDTSGRGSTRDRLLDAASDRFRTQGFAATGVKQILTAAQAPYGSLYHFFPGGKQQLGVAVIDRDGAVFERLVRDHFAGDEDIVALVGGFFDGAAAVLTATDFADACPIATYAAETASTDEPMRVAAANAFTSWIRALAQRLEAEGLEGAAALALAQQAFCLFEGALLLARVTRDAAAVRRAGEAMAELVASALEIERRFVLD